MANKTAPNQSRDADDEVGHEADEPTGAARSGNRDARRHIVSVRFSEPELDRIQAAGLIFELSPNEIIRRACDSYINQLLDTKEYEEALARYRKRSEDHIAALEEMRINR